MDIAQRGGKDGVMALALADTGCSVASALEDAHLREDVETYACLFGTCATWITSRGVLFAGRDDLRDYLALVMPGGLAGGSVSYRVAKTIAAGDAVVVVIDQEYRGAGRVGAIVLGRRTYEMFAGYWPSVDPNDEPVASPVNALSKHIISTTLDAAPWGDHAPAVIESGDAMESVKRLRAAVEGDLLVWGSLQLADALLAGLVDVLRLRVIPSLIGDGRGPTPTDLAQSVITQVASHVGLGWVTLAYEVKR